MEESDFYSAEESENANNEPSTSEVAIKKSLRNREVNFSKPIVKKKRNRKKKENVIEMSGSQNNQGQNVHNEDEEEILFEDEANAGAANDNDNVFEGLSPNKVNKLKDFVKKQVREAVKETQQIRVTTVNPRIDIPEYHYERMTSETYFNKCTNYFKSQGYPPSQFHQVVSTILKGDTRLWHDNVVSTINSWSDFCKAFKAKYDSEAVREKRKRFLYTRKQQFHESVEQFVYEMVNLGRQVEPNESEEISVNRAYEAMHPDIYRAIGDLHIKTVNNVIEQANRAVRAIRASDKLKGTYTRLPPVYGYTKKDDKNFRGRSSSFGGG